MGGLAGCGGPEPGGPSSPSSVRELADRWGFEDTVRLQAVGGDPSGRDPIDDALERAAADSALVIMEPGRYRLASGFEWLEFDRFGLLGDDATIVPEDGNDQTILELGRPGEAGSLLVGGLEFDFRAAGTGGRPVVGQVDDRLVLRDITVRGPQDVESDMIRIDVASPDGTGIVERLRLADGADPGGWDGDSGVTGCEVGSENRGDLDFVDCRIEGFPDNGLYADPPEGRVRVLGGYFANNGVANVRVNAGPGSVVRGVQVRCDAAPVGVENMRGIRLRGGGPILVEDCLVEMETVTGSDGAITVHSELESATIRNARLVTNAADVVGVRVKSPSSGISAAGPVAIENVEITGDATGVGAIDIADRENCSIEGVCIHQTGRNRDGIRAADTSGRVIASAIAVRGRPLAFENSAMETKDVSIHRRPRRLSGQFCRTGE